MWHREKIIFSNVINHTTKSCGDCRQKVNSWYIENEEIIRKLKCPLNNDDVPPGGPKIVKTIETAKKPFDAICPACGNHYEPRWEGIRQGVSLTCGCSSYRVSFAQKEIAEFIQSLRVDIKLEHEVNGLNYDIFVPSKNLLIEYNGLKWHSNQESKQRDIEKYRNAIENKYSFLLIFEDEWVYNKEKVKSLLCNKLSIIKSISLRPLKCEIKQIHSDLSNPFYEKFHYIGKANAKVHYGVFYQEKLVAAMSFSHPTRQTSPYNFELTRMASDPNYRIHGIWSKLLNLFIKEFNPSSIVSFSDNRLFQGETYGKIGFKLDGGIRPDYYWFKGQRRFHKSGLRKQKHEMASGLTETVLREAQGYRKIWDLGKKRWVMNFVLF